MSLRSPRQSSEFHCLSNYNIYRRGNSVNVSSYSRVTRSELLNATSKEQLNVGSATAKEPTSGGNASVMTVEVQTLMMIAAAGWIIQRILCAATGR